MHSRRSRVSGAVSTVLPTPVSVPVMKSVCFICQHQNGNSINKPIQTGTRITVTLDNGHIWTLSCPYMKAITYTAAREGLASTMDRVCRDRSPIIITRNRNQSVVMLSLADYEQLEETSYLLRSPANARRLLSAIGSLKKGKGRVRKIDVAA